MFVREKEMERATSWVDKWSNVQLSEQIAMFDNILEFDNVDDFIFLDEILEFRQIMLEKCVGRLTQTLPNV